MDDRTRAGIVRQATFSDDRNYRYTLGRWWDSFAPSMTIIGLNPSTADETVDDPTIRRCVHFAHRQGCGGIAMLNLFALRSTDPRAMESFAGDPIGPENDRYLQTWCAMSIEGGGLVVAAWGNHGGHRNRSLHVREMLAENGIPLYCWGLTDKKEPRHPLYLKGDTPLQRWWYGEKRGAGVERQTAGYPVLEAPAAVQQTQNQ